MPALAPLGKEFYRDFPELPGEFDPTSFVASWSAFLGSGGHGLVLMAESGGAPVGALGLLSYRDPNTGLEVADELFWFVSRLHRGSIGPKLLIAAVDLCRRAGITRLHMMHLISDERPARIYERLGFKPTQRVFAKDL